MSSEADYEPDTAIRDALEQIAEHFDDQSFPTGWLRASCEEVIVNYAAAALNGYEGSLAEYAEEHYLSRDGVPKP